MKCKNCGNEFEGKFCNNCAQSSRVGKFTLKNLLEELSANIFQINQGFLFTAKSLMSRPGHSIQEYLDGQRKRYFKPITYVLVISTFYYILNRIFEHNNIVEDFFQGYRANEGDAQNLTILQWFSNNFAYTVLLLIPFFSIATYIFFRKRHQNYIEHIVINTFVTGQQLVFWICFLIIEIIVGGYYFLELIAFMLSFIFRFWTYIQFFKQYNKFNTAFRLFLSYLLFLIFLILITGLLDFIIGLDI